MCTQTLVKDILFVESIIHSEEKLEENKQLVTKIQQNCQNKVDNASSKPGINLRSKSLILTLIF